MDIFTLEDVDKFFDKFEDPSLEMERIGDVIHQLYDPIAVPYNLSKAQARWSTQEYFLKKLIMKAYRLGKDHAYANSIATIRDR